MPGNEDDRDGGSDERANGSTGGDDRRVVVDRGTDSETYSANEDAVESESGFSVDPIGVGIALAIVLVAVGLLLVGPLSGDAGTPTAPPDADFRVVRINETHVQLAHTGGDEMAGDRLSVAVDGEPRSPGWPDSVGEGDVVLFRADGNSSIDLYWEGRDERTAIGNWTV